MDRNIHFCHCHHRLRRHPAASSITQVTQWDLIQGSHHGNSPTNYDDARDHIPLCNPVCCVLRWQWMQSQQNWVETHIPPSAAQARHFKMRGNTFQSMQAGSKDQDATLFWVGIHKARSFLLLTACSVRRHFKGKIKGDYGKSVANLRSLKSMGYKLQRIL